MRAIICLLTCSFFCLAAYTQVKNVDSLQNTLFGALEIFNSDTEKEFLSKKEFSVDDILKLYLTTSGSIDLETTTNKINAFIEKNNKTSYKSKDLKRLYKDVHSDFLVRYIDNPAFAEIFTNGNYNCATASALYAHILDKINVTYSIRETPTHVYIVADPGSANIVFETTAPGMKTLQVTDKLKAAFLEYLVKNKMITQAEASGATKDALFEKHFYGDEKIDRKQLAGILYYNLGVDALTKEDDMAAYKNFEKALILHPSKRIEYLTAVSLLSVIYKRQNDKNKNPWAHYIRYSQLNKGELGVDAVKEYWNGVIKKNYFESPSPGEVKRIYLTMLPFIVDTSLKKDVQFDYYYNTAHYMDIKNKLDTSLLYLDSAYGVSPQNLFLQEQISNTLIQNVISSGNPDTFVVNKLNSYFNRYPFIDKNSKLGEYYIYAVSYVATNFLGADKKKEGDKYLGILKNIVKEMPVVGKKNESYITEAMLQGFYYYIRHRQYKEAKQYIESVLKILPENEEIKKRLQSVNDIIANS